MVTNTCYLKSQSGYNDTNNYTVKEHSIYSVTMCHCQMCLHAYYLYWTITLWQQNFSDRDLKLSLNHGKPNPPELSGSLDTKPIYPV